MNIFDNDNDYDYDYNAEYLRISDMIKVSIKNKCIDNTLDNIDIKYIEQYLRKKKLEKINNK